MLQPSTNTWRITSPVFTGSLGSVAFLGMRRQKKKTSHKEVRCPEEPAAPHYSDTTCVLPQLPSQRPDRLRRFPPFRRFPHSAASLPLPWGAAGGRPLFPPTFPLPALPAALSLSVCRWCCESRAGSRGLGGRRFAGAQPFPPPGRERSRACGEEKKNHPKVQGHLLTGV